MATTDDSPPPYDPSANANYPPVDETKIAYVEVFPAIGVARMGNSGFDTNTGQRSGPVSYFLGPEYPGTVYGPEGGFRDAAQSIKRQGVRFRVYAYDSDGNILGEVNAKNNYTLSWTVDVANVKAASTIFNGQYTTPQRTALRNPDIQPDLPIHERSRLVIKPEKPITISGKQLTTPVIGTFQGSRDSPAKAVQVDLGDAKTDDAGRLIYVGGSGWSQCVTETPGFKPDAEYPLQPEIISEFDSVDWFDSSCDGNISVQISKGNITRSSRHNAWVLSGPPDFAWGIDAPTTLWDVMENVYNKNSTSFVADPEVRFYRDIWPVLTTTYATSWTNKDALQGHGPDGKGNFLKMEEALKDKKQTALHSHIFGRLRMPEYLNPDQASTRWMPRLSGDAGDAVEPGTILPAARQTNEIRRFASLTPLQYERFKRWSQGDFSVVPYPEREAKKLEDLPVNNQPEYLTRATLHTTIGDPLYPGIEAYWIVKKAEVYDFSVDATVRPPFRFKASLRPGDMTRGLSLPWQADFSECEQHWWPSARPDDVVSEYDFLHVVPQVVRDGSSFADVLDSVPRRHWTYPMRVSPGNLSDFYPGSTDMARMWEALGFVTRIDFPNQLPIYIEVQRLLPTDTGGDVVPTEEPTAQDVEKALGASSQWKLNIKGRLVPST